MRHQSARREPIHPECHNPVLVQILEIKLITLESPRAATITHAYRPAIDGKHPSRMRHTLAACQIVAVRFSAEKCSALHTLKVARRVSPRE